MNDCILQFYGYSVPKIHFKIGEKFGGNEIQMNVNMTRTIEPLSTENNGNSDKEQHYIVLFFLTLGEEENENGFFADIVVKGHFSSSCNPFPADNATAILFPYVRSIVTSICTTANIPPLILPVINITDAFKEEKK